MFKRIAHPRRLGLLSGVEPATRSRSKQPFPYAAGDRISGDLTVIGHLACGRLGHLYQVWSAAEWCAYTCKILSPHHRDSRRAVAALRRESRVLRRLDHPNIIRRFAEGEHDGLPYLLMEYVEGPSIFDVLESRPERRLAISDAVRTAIHIGAGLYHLHRQGYLHLDLKPANLLLRGNVPVLVDFDAARPLDPQRRPARALGTAPYMAPEQVRAQPTTPATDVYGLAAVLYEMITGRWPFEEVYTGREEREGEERQYPQLGGPLPPGPRAYNPEVSATLDALILSCLAADATERPQTLHPVLLGLTEELAEPVAFWPDGVQTERRREPRV
ncbi:MAG: serine/threonine-protein kinase [Longimicrobiales bacterium]